MLEKIAVICTKGATLIFISKFEAPMVLCIVKPRRCFFVWFYPGIRRRRRIRALKPQQRIRLNLISGGRPSQYSETRTVSEDLQKEPAYWYAAYKRALRTQFNDSQNTRHLLKPAKVCAWTWPGTNDGRVNGFSTLANLYISPWM